MLDKLQKIPTTRLLGASVRNLHPSHLNLWSKDLLKVNRSAGSTSKHLRETMIWLRRAHDAQDGNGVSGGYSFLDGWLGPYPETTGYIIPTFYDYAKYSGDEEWAARAEVMADWEIEVQMPNGAVQAGLYTPDKEQVPAVFNTGQVILGWCRTHAETENKKYLDAAEKAAAWLIDIQSSDGAWRFDSKETETDVHTYDVRTAWSLLELWQISGKEEYKLAARSQLGWALKQQTKNGWFENNAFFVSKEKWTAPFTHMIAYVMEGFLESYLILNDERYLTAARNTGYKLLRIFELRRLMAGDFDEKWKSSGLYTCLTGNAQIAGVWIKLFEIFDDVRFLNSALKLNDATKAAQDLSALHGGIRGGLKGSHPINGKYTPFLFPNWAAKFFADTLMAEERAMSEFEQRVLCDEKIGQVSIFASAN